MSRCQCNIISTRCLIFGSLFTALFIYLACLPLPFSYCPFCLQATIPAGQLGLSLSAGFCKHGQFLGGTSWVWLRNIVVNWFFFYNWITSYQNITLMPFLVALRDLMIHVYFKRYEKGLIFTQVSTNTSPLNICIRVELVHILKPMDAWTCT